MSLCVLNLTGTSTPINAPVAQQIIGTLNGYRSQVDPPATNMHRLNYSFEFQGRLEELVKEKGPNWFFEPSNRIPVIHQGWNVFYVQEILGTSFQFLWLDTCRADSLSCVLDNIHYRYSQKHCFNYYTCSTSVWDRFKTCTEPFIPGPNLPCSYEFAYYPWFIYGPLDQIACVVLFVPGPFAPPKQDNSLICFGHVLEQPVNDRPYDFL